MRARMAALVGLALAAASVARAQVTINNGLVGDGSWVVISENGGDTRSGVLDPTGSVIAAGDLIFDLFTYVDTGANGGAARLSASTTTPAALVAGQVVSSGSFAGLNGTVNWTATASIPAGVAAYNVTLSFTSASPFGVLRVIHYFDEDVIAGDAGDDVLILFGTPGNPDFFLLTLDSTDNIGIGHTAQFVGITGATYVGWAADKWQDLKTALTGAGATYSIAGNIDTVDLLSMVDGRHPTRPAYGPRDITQAFAFDLDPAATSATVVVTLSGAPSGGTPVELLDFAVD